MALLVDPEAAIKRDVAAVAWLMLIGGPEDIAARITTVKDLQYQRTLDPTLLDPDVDLDGLVSRLEQHHGIARRAVALVDELSEGPKWQSGKLRVQGQRPGKDLSLLAFLVWDWCCQQSENPHLMSNNVQNREACAAAISRWVPEPNLGTSRDDPIHAAFESLKRFGRRLSGST